MTNAEQKKAAVVLSGCGVYDGSEIQESVTVIMALEKNGVEPVFFAPDKLQAEVVNHETGKVCPEEKRNILIESARIARGNVKPLSGYIPEKFCALIFPGGSGAIKNLCNYAVKGCDCEVDGDVKNAILSTLKAKKRMGFVCISPIIAAKTIGSGVKLTIGNDIDTARDIEMMGAKHIECTADSFVVDEKFGVYSTPAYMLANNTVDLIKGIGGMISSILKD